MLVNRKHFIGFIQLVIAHLKMSRKLLFYCSRLSVQISAHSPILSSHQEWQPQACLAIQVASVADKPNRMTKKWFGTWLARVYPKLLSPCASIYDLHLIFGMRLWFWVHLFWQLGSFFLNDCLIDGNQMAQCTKIDWQNFIHVRSLCGTENPPVI